MYYVAFRKLRNTPAPPSVDDSDTVLHIGGPHNDQYITSMKSVNSGLLYVGPFLPCLSSPRSA